MLSQLNRNGTVNSKAKGQASMITAHENILKQFQKEQSNRSENYSSRMATPKDIDEDQLYCSTESTFTSLLHDQNNNQDLGISSQMPRNKTQVNYFLANLTNLIKKTRPKLKSGGLQKNYSVNLGCYLRQELNHITCCSHYQTVEKDQPLETNLNLKQQMIINRLGSDLKSTLGTKMTTRVKSKPQMETKTKDNTNLQGQIIIKANSNRKDKQFLFPIVQINPKSKLTIQTYIGNTFNIDKELDQNQSSKQSTKNEVIQSMKTQVIQSTKNEVVQIDDSTPTTTTTTTTNYQQSCEPHKLKVMKIWNFKSTKNNKNFLLTAADTPIEEEQQDSISPRDRVESYQSNCKDNKQFKDKLRTSSFSSFKRSSTVQRGVSAQRNNSVQNTNSVQKTNSVQRAVSNSKRTNNIQINSTDQKTIINTANNTNITSFTINPLSHNNTIQTSNNNSNTLSYLMSHKLSCNLALTMFEKGVNNQIRKKKCQEKNKKKFYNIK